MSRFNQSVLTRSTKTQNLAGGEAFAQSPKLELVSLLLTSFVKNQFYRTADETVERLKELISTIKDKEFVAKAAVYARTKFGMRSITHVVAGELFRMDKKTTAVSGESWVKNFINTVVYRPDDALEVMSYFKTNVMKDAIPNQLRKGLAGALSKFNAHTLAKYRGEGKDFKMVDVVNLVHPRSTEAIDKLVAGTLKVQNTFESELSAAGQNAETEEEKIELKGAAWKKLILEKKLGYFALLRNLRNIFEQAPDVMYEALEMLTDEKLIRGSLVLPFRYLTAIEEIQKIRKVGTSPILAALNKAIDIACKNVPEFDGRTAIVMDESGSMNGKPHEIGSLFAAILFKANPKAIVYKFADNCGFLKGLNPGDSTLTLAQQIGKHWGMGGGTDFHAIFRGLVESYDRVIILSDEQGWVGYKAPVTTFNEYKKKYNCSPRLYSFDLAGHGTLQFPEKDVYCVAGFSEKVFDLMKMLEEDRNAMVNAIEKVEFTPLRVPQIKKPVRRIIRKVRKIVKPIKKTRKSR